MSKNESIQFLSREGQREVLSLHEKRLEGLLTRGEIKRYRSLTLKALLTAGLVWSV